MGLMVIKQFLFWGISKVVLGCRSSDMQRFHFLYQDFNRVDVTALMVKADSWARREFVAFAVEDPSEAQ